MIDDALLFDIRAKAELLFQCYSSTIALDKALGEVEAAIYTARQAISDDWYAERRRQAQRGHCPPNHSTSPSLDELA